MDMSDLIARTGLPPRRLRYVLDHGVLPGLRGGARGHGVPRTFTPFEGFAIALAAHLLGAGVGRAVVAAALDAACRPAARAPADVPLARAYAARAGRLEIGDGRCLRVLAPARAGVGAALDTGWFAAGPSGPVPGDYTPVVCVTVELAALARAVHGDRGGATPAPGGERSTAPHPNRK